MSAVLAPNPPAAVAAPTVPSCATCRRHRVSNDTLRCTEMRSNAVGGVVVVSVSAAKKAETFERICALVAERCKFYQEEA